MAGDSLDLPSNRYSGIQREGHGFFPLVKMLVLLNPKSIRERLFVEPATLRKQEGVTSFDCSRIGPDC